MNVLIGCEESQTVTIAFRELGHDAFSCDLLPCSGWKPDWHLQTDIFDAMKMKKWDLIGLHCPCTYTCLSGNAWYYNSPLRKQGAEFTAKCWFTACELSERVYLEQPMSMIGKYIGKKTQTINPYEFGHGERKQTWLWLKNLPVLVPTNVVSGRKEKIFNMGSNYNRRLLRSKTYPGFAAAMAAQWNF
jgi:hypothetical protein